MIEKAERTIGGERRKPERKPRQLHGHRIDIHAIEGTLGHGSPDRDPFRFTDVARVARAGPHEGRLVGLSQIAAGGNQKCAASHRRIDDAQSKNRVGIRIAYQWREGPPHQVVRNRLWRVERAGRLPNPGSAFEGHTCSIDARFVVEQRLVHGAELLNAKVAIGDTLATSAIDGRPCRQCQDRAPRGVIVEAATLGQRCP